MAVSAILCVPRRRKEHGDRDPEAPRGLKVGELSIADQGAQREAEDGVAKSTLSYRQSSSPVATLIALTRPMPFASGAST